MLYSPGQTLQDLDAEISVIGSMLLDPKAVKACAFLSREDFVDREAQLIFDAIIDLFERQSPVDLVTVDEQLQKNLGEHFSPDLIQKMASATQYVPTTANANLYAKIVQEKSNRRRLIDIGSELQRMASDSAVEVDAAIEEARQAMNGLKQGRGQWTGIQRILLDTYAQIEQRMKGEYMPIQTGVAPLDRMFYGFLPGELTIIGARPGVGKSAFAVCVALEAARRGKRVGIVSLEMSREQYGQRMLANYSGVDSIKIRSADMDPDSLESVVTAMGALAPLPMDFLFDCWTIERLAAQVQRRVDENGLDFLVIDYLQLLRTSRKTNSDYEKVTRISQTLKELTIRLNIPILSLAQLSRAGAQRSDKRPLLSDLRDSGSIEQDADNVIFLHRPDDEMDKGVEKDDREGFQEWVRAGYHYLHIGIAKQRQGQIGYGNLLFYPPLMRYSTIDRR